MNKKSLVAIALLAVSAISSAQSVYPGQHQGKMKKETVAPVRVESFDFERRPFITESLSWQYVAGFRMDDLY